MNKDQIAILDACIGNSQGLGFVLPFYAQRRGNDHGPTVQRMIDQATMPLLELSGSRPANKQAVSAHESGHGVIAHLVGYRVRNVGVWIEVRNQWVGRVNVDDSDSGKVTDLWLWREALARIAGYVGERLEGLDHPASAIDEQLHSWAIGRYFDELHQTERGYHFTRAIKQCEDALGSNKEIFEEIEYRLLATNRVSGAEIGRLMERALPLPIRTPDDGGNKNGC